MKDLIEKIITFFANIPHDKLLHYDGGLLIALYLAAVLLRFTPLWWAIGIADAITIGVLIWKEIYDSKKAGHSVELWDVLAGVFGMLTSNAAMLIMLL